MKKDLFTAELEYLIYLSLPKECQETVNLTLDSYEEKDYFSEIPLEERDFITVKELMECLINNDFEGFGERLSQLDEYSNNKIYKAKTYEVILTMRYLIDHTIKLLEVEDKMLTSKVASKHDYSTEVSQVDFTVFPHYYSQLRSLAGNDILKFDAVKKLKYSDCFVELLYLSKDSDLEKLILKHTK